MILLRPMTKLHTKSRFMMMAFIPFILNLFNINLFIIYTFLNRLYLFIMSLFINNMNLFSLYISQPTCSSHKALIFKFLSLLINHSCPLPRYWGY